MASCVTFTQFNMQNNNDQQSDTRSESSSMDSDWSDLKSIAMELGVTNLDNLHTERFKIDRQKLCDMIQSKVLIFLEKFILT